jgi:hypothetical protein
MLIEEVIELVIVLQERSDLVAVFQAALVDQVEQLERLQVIQGRAQLQG